MKKYVFFALVAVSLGAMVWSCKKDVLKSQIGDNTPTVMSSGTTLYENEVDATLKETAKAVAILAYQNQVFRDETKNQMLMQFDGDYNVLFRNLNQELASSPGMNVYEELQNASTMFGDRTNTEYLDGFTIARDSEKNTYYPQIYTPDEEYLPADHIPAKVARL